MVSPGSAAVTGCSGECWLYMRRSCLVQGHDKRGTCTVVSEEHVPSVLYRRWEEIIISSISPLCMVSTDISLMHGVYTYIPETNHVPREHCVATILMLLFMVRRSLVPTLIPSLRYHFPQYVCSAQCGCFL
jgi:hypothetical protein